MFSELHDQLQLASLKKHSTLTRCFSAIAELLVLDSSPFPAFTVDVNNESWLLLGDNVEITVPDRLRETKSNLYSSIDVDQIWTRQASCAFSKIDIDVAILDISCMNERYNELSYVYDVLRQRWRSRFLSRDATQSAVLQQYVVCLSVCPSV